MKKYFSWILEHALFIVTLFLLAFIPLYPKIPLVDIQNTWVYIRAEDFVVFLVLILWTIYLIRNKITLRTPLTLPIFGFWIVGAVATIHGIILLFPNLANVFPNVAFLSFLRNIEYISVFFVAFSAMRDKKFLKIIIFVLVLTLLAIIFYGFGQRFLGFPAFLTMNEEFAKGVPIQLSELSRVPSTFAGHYDLAAYLVLIIPIVVSLIFGFKNWFIKIFLGITTILGFVLLFMTVSRVSFFVLILSLLIVLFFQKRKLVLFSVPVLVILGFAFLILRPTTLLERFSDTVNEVNVLVNAETGQAIAHVEYVSPDYFNEKIIAQQDIGTTQELSDVLNGVLQDDTAATPSAFLPARLFPQKIPLVIDRNVSTGEELIQGTGYINLSLSPVDKKLGNFFYEITDEKNSNISADVLILHGDFLVKRAAAYDLSFTTRFQGGWPNALESFERNVFLGSGYGTVTLAVDNNYLRILGEIGILGLLSYAGIFVTLGIYIVRVLPKTDSSLLKSFVIGYAAGVIGIALNATLIDVFAASKVAFVLWLLTGVVVGLLSLYQVRELDFKAELRNFTLSPVAIILYIFILTFVIYIPILNNYFIGDDFTWFRWAVDCTYGGLQSCPNIFERIADYFTSANGFFYRPGTKTFFLVGYSVFWLNQVVFHLISIMLHAIVVALFFLLSRKVLKSNLLAALGGILFIVMSGYAEVVFWISGIGHLFNAVFVMFSILLFSAWNNSRKVYYLLGSIVSIFLATFFHELGVVAPLLIIIYSLFVTKRFTIKRLHKKIDIFVLFIPVVLYLLMRYMAKSHWSGGDYSYDILMLPFNVVGNIFGYVMIVILGPMSLSFYQVIRTTLRENIFVAGILAVIFIGILFILYQYLWKKIKQDDIKIILFGIAFFIISLLPFIALGNIASRYSYLASIGIVIIMVFILGKLLRILMRYGAGIAYGGMLVLLSIFTLFHIIQIQQLHGDWKTAGDKVEQFLISMDSLYRDSWASAETELHFVNVPIKHNDAWVFPVGVEDALWLTFQNDDLKVVNHQSIDDAVDLVGLFPHKSILVFEENGHIEEIRVFKSIYTGDIEYEFVNTERE